MVVMRSYDIRTSFYLRLGEWGRKVTRDPIERSYLHWFSFIYSVIFSFEEHFETAIKRMIVREVKLT